MRALPFELFRRRLRRVGKPQRGAVVMGDGEPETLRQKSEAGNGGGRYEFAERFGLHEGRLAGGPGDEPVGPDRDVVDPAMLWIGGERAGFALCIGGDDLAVVAATDDAFVVGCGREDRAGMDRDPSW